MIRYGFHTLGMAMAVGLLGLTLSACGPRVIISTGTTIGLKATPGDGYTRPPQVTLGYKRAETALVPTAGAKATSTADAFSTLAVIHFSTLWFGTTELQSFLGTGIAARELQGLAEDKPAPQGIQRPEGKKTSDFWNQFSPQGK